MYSLVLNFFSAALEFLLNEQNKDKGCDSENVDNGDDNNGGILLII